MLEALVILLDLSCAGSNKTAPKDLRKCYEVGHSFHNILDALQASKTTMFEFQIFRYSTFFGQVDFSIIIKWTSPFPILGVSGILFHFYSIFDRNSC